MKGLQLAADRLNDFAEIRRNLEQGNTPMLATGLSQIHKVHLIYALAGGGRLVITPDEPSAVRMAEDLNRFFEEERAVVYPSREFSFREVEGVSREYEFARLKVLNGISQGRICLVVCSIEALLQYTLPPKTLRENTLALHPGEEHSLQALSARLLHAGYERRDQVEGVCQFCHRGGILDF